MTYLLKHFMVKNVLIEGRHMNNSTQINDTLKHDYSTANQAINVQDKPANFLMTITKISM